MRSVDAGAPVRGISVGALSALVTAAAHHMGGGMMPSESAIVALILACAGVGWFSAATPGRSWVVARVIACLAAAQIIGHLLLTIIDGHHHGALLDFHMAAAHVTAVFVGGALIVCAERGAVTAASAIRRALPLVDAALVVPSAVSTPAHRSARALTPRMVDLSGCGTRGPPARV